MKRTKIRLITIFTLIFVTTLSIIPAVYAKPRNTYLTDFLYECEVREEGFSNSAENDDEMIDISPVAGVFRNFSRYFSIRWQQAQYFGVDIDAKCKDTEYNGYHTHGNEDGDGVFCAEVNDVSNQEATLVQTQTSAFKVTTDANSASTFSAISPRKCRFSITDCRYSHYSPPE